MSNVIRFHIPLLPHPKQSMRHRAAFTETGKPFVMSYPDGKVRRNAHDMMTMILANAEPGLWSGPVRLDIQVVYPWRKATPQKHRDAGFEWKSTKPDVDNLHKQVADCLEQLRFVLNDSQIADARIRKTYGHQPGTWIELERLRQPWE